VTWLKLDDRFAAHPKISPLSDGAFRLHICGLLFSSAHQTDGRIQREQIPILMPRYRPRYLDELVVRGLWLPHDEIVEINDYLDYNPSRTEIAVGLAHLSRVRSEAGRKGAQSRWGRREP